ncbi:MAG: peptidylprolyl isomerase [Clostridiales bacterium]|nr:peptidylprolyl isomerase [Clostridiales bacterium]
MKQNLKKRLATLCGLMAMALTAACVAANEQPAASPSTTPEETEQASEQASEEVTESPPATVDLSEYPELELPQLTPVKAGEEIAVMETSMGTIKMRFFPEYAPKAVENFITRAKEGYYNETIFHRVIDEFMIQGGDPRGDGTGGQSMWGEPFEMEIVPNLHHIRGALAMARSQAEVSQGSQFYIVQNKKLDESSAEMLQSFLEGQDHVAAEDEEGKPIPIAQLFPQKMVDQYLEIGGVPSLDYNYTVFGQVIEGMDVVDKIAAVETSQDEKKLDKPLEDIVIQNITFESYTA